MWGVELHCGTSGFSYPAWRGVFYPAALASSRMLDHYQRHLNALEVNQSFYRLPQPAALERWTKATGEDFRFCCKVPRALTYSGGGFDRAGFAEVTRRRLLLLGSRLGPVLVQWPPARARDDALLDGLLGALALPAAVEFRHPAWQDAGVDSVLARHGAVRVTSDDERWPNLEVAPDAPFAYLRLRRDYGEAELGALARRLAELALGREVYAFFRHQLEGPRRAMTVLSASLPRG